MRPFLDTNILVHAVLSDDPRREAAEKAFLASGTVSVQVMIEFANVARRKLGWDWPAVEAALDLVERQCRPVRALTLATHRAAIGLSRDHGLSVYDGLIVAAALEAGCDQLPAEDSQAGRRFGALATTNPFA